VLACEVAADIPTRIRRVDPLRLIARRAERMTPWFYEKRLGSPRWLRQTYLRVLRNLSSAPRLPRDPVSPFGGVSRELVTDTLIVGGGPAGFAAARMLAERGVKALLVEREPWSGSRRSVSAGLSDEMGSLPEIQAITGATCVGLYEEEDFAAIVSPDGPASVRFDRLVIATGAYDRPLAYVGNDLPGTIGLRAFERYAAMGSFSAATRVGVVAAPGEAVRAVAAARAAGIHLAFVAGPGNVPVDDDVALPWRRLDRVDGHRRVRSVTFDDETSFACDVLVIGFTQPTFELQIQAGATATVDGNPPVVVPSGDTRFPVLAVGEAAGHVDHAAGDAGSAVDAWLRGEDPPSVRVHDILEPALRAPDAFACLCEDVRIRDLTAAVEEGFGSAELVKRRTGAGTGPCQGKLCLGEVAAVLGAAGIPPDLPTVRPPAWPASIAALGRSADA
jgi:sarcosine oxidase subunit alpha